MAASRKAGTKRAPVKKSASKQSAAAEKPARAKKTAARKIAVRKTAANKAAARKTARGRTKEKSGQPKLLSGDNPQIAKGYGDGPVQAYIAAIPGWKQQLAQRLDAVITRAVPGVHKAVKWNSPMYGLQDDLWFLSFHCYTRFIKVMFTRGSSLKPPPPGPSKHADVRYYDIPEGGLDESQFTDWVKQAAKLPGMKM